MKWRKWKQPLRAIPCNGIPIGNPSSHILISIYNLDENMTNM